MASMAMLNNQRVITINSLLARVNHEDVGRWLFGLGLRRWNNQKKSENIRKHLNKLPTHEQYQKNTQNT